MNRFRTKKKGKEDPSARGRASEESESGLSFFSRKKKPQAEEEKPAINLENALPSTDEFRTSLLMTGLSARFSMLREQDDPSTKIGKASDDSVLFPKRQSRLAETGGFGPPGLGGLSDIAEVESVKGSFARMNSYASGSDDADGGGIMNRARPTEGNVLFGGRQKIYRIPAGGTKSGEGKMGGRALYEDDVPMSSFQKWKQQEKEMQSQNGGDADYARTTDSVSRAGSPAPADYNFKRETSSTTSSAPSVQRNSTAATSIVSGPTQPPKDFAPVVISNASPSILERSVTRTRRLYEQGLNQEMQDQQTSALSRIDTIARRGLGGNSPSPTGFGFSDRFDTRRNVLTKASAPNLRSFTPPTTGSSFSTIDTGARPGRSPVAEARAVFAQDPPISPPVSDTGSDQLIIPIQPADRGKATAMGVFNKPQNKYDDSMFAQRQLQMQQGRESPAPRFRAESTTRNTARSRSNSATRHDSIAEKVTEKMTEKTPQKSKPLVEENQQRPITFLDDSDTSSLATSHSAPQTKPPVVIERPADSEHPAFRQSALPTPLSLGTGEREKSSTRTNMLSPQSYNDSPTLGSSSSTPSGLGGLVRSHLRSDSNTSSVYGAAAVTSPTSGLEAHYSVDYQNMDSGVDTNLVIDSILTSDSKPWEACESQWGVSVYGTNGFDASNKKATESSKREGEKAAVDKDKVTPTPNPNNTSSFSDEETPTPNPNNTSSFSDKEKEPTLSQPEQNEFARELAEGARRVRERLTSYVESDSSRAPSPHDSLSDLQVSKPHGLGLLRTKTSRGTLSDRSRAEVANNNIPATNSGKAMKMLRLGSNSTATSPTSQTQTLEEAAAPPVAVPKETDNIQEYSSVRQEPRPNIRPEPAPASGIPIPVPIQELKEESNVELTLNKDQIQAQNYNYTPRKKRPETESRDQSSTQVPNLIQSPDNNLDVTSDVKMHPGVKAFRQARREMQRLKELETQTRHQGSVQLTDTSAVDRTPPMEQPQGLPQQSQLQHASRERKLPPTFHSATSQAHIQQPRGRMRAPSEESKQSTGTMSRSTSRAPSEQRDRSGSETSNTGGRPRSRPPRLRNGSVLQDERAYYHPPIHGGSGYSHIQGPQMRSPMQGPHGMNNQGPSLSRGPTLRSPGLPGTDIRRSPHMPPQSYSPIMSPATGYFPAQGSYSNGNLQPGRPESGYPSPTSPIVPLGITVSPLGPGAGSTSPNLPISRSRGPSAPTTPSFENPPTMNGPKPELIKKVVNKAEISDPTLVSMTSRVPTVSIPEEARARSRSGSRSRSNSNTTLSSYVPPVPPFNPRRRAESSRTRNAIGCLKGRQDDGTSNLPVVSPTPPDAEESRSAFSHSDDEDVKPTRRRLRKATSVANGLNSHSRSSPPRASPPTQSVMPLPRPSPSSNVMDMNLPGGLI